MITVWGLWLGFFDSFGGVGWEDGIVLDTLRMRFLHAKLAEPAKPC